MLLFSPLVRAGRIYYPPPRAESGWGIVTGWQLRALFASTSITKVVKDDPDQPFIRSIPDNAPFYRNRTLCPVPGVRMFAFLPTSNAIEAPPGKYSGIPVFQMPAFHGGLIGREMVQNRLVDILSGQDINAPRAEYQAFQQLGAAWQAPGLALSINLAWREVRKPYPAFTGEITCPPL